MKTLRNFVAIIIAVAAVHAPQAASACAACMGDPNANIAKGANAAIFLMLGLLGGMFSLIGGAGYYIYKHSKMPAPPHAELDEEAGVQPEPSAN